MFLDKKNTCFLHTPGGSTLTASLTVKYPGYLWRLPLKVLVFSGVHRFSWHWVRTATITGKIIQNFLDALWVRSVLNKPLEGFKIPEPEARYSRHQEQAQVRSTFIGRSVWSQLEMLDEATRQFTFPPQIRPSHFDSLLDDIWWPIWFNSKCNMRQQVNSHFLQTWPNQKANNNFHKYNHNNHRGANHKVRAVLQLWRLLRLLQLLQLRRWGD